MNLRTITCWAVYNPKRRRIVNGHRTKKELQHFYSAGIPIGCVVVKMQGRYPSRNAASSDASKDQS